ncbi:MAG: hypothetical protein K9K65_11025 [Desulfarculaceae bacterium]|nr:hypothetical protein [Desulfarculaceae bacterium]MCF8048255.1 hypothetical protein [Desulfarculaceae bacterium]MCF8066426.1 hypothetical protein [Desulfarculaceae bacterium]MCF8098366.1 hypothetical protein [Desulfarculaceae bacterium]MCF8122871.1 hypothetical protein [Desulfarculaceae bacterium]
MRFDRACLALAAMALILTWAFPAFAADNPFKLAPPFKSAIIKYTYSGTQKGQSTVYYKGNVQAEHKQVATKILGFGSEDNTITITEPQRITTVDLGKKEAYYTGNSMTYMAQEYEKLTPAEKKRVKKNAEEMAGNFLAAMGGGKPEIKQGTFMNHPVEIVTVMGLTSYTWKGKHVVLKQEGGVMGMQMNMTATSIKTGVPVPSDKLQVPAGMKAVFNQEADQQQKDMAKRVMDMLKDPDFGKKQGQMPAQASQEQSQQAPASSGSSSDQEKQADPVKEGLDAVKKLFKW